MNIGVATEKGLQAINNAITSHGVFVTFAKASLNNAIVPLPNEEITDLPSPCFDGYVNSVNYDPNSKGMIIQCVFNGEHPVLQYNSAGVYDVDGNLLFYSKQHAPAVFFRGSTIRYHFWIPLFNNVDEFTNIRIMVPESRVVHHVYEFSNPSMYWRAQHNLLTPFVQFTVFDWHGQVITQDKYDAYVTPGFVHIAFKNEQYRGFISLQGEGTAFSIQLGQSTEQLTNPYVDYQPEFDDDIPWITGTLLS